MADNQLKKLILLAISLGLVYSCSEESIQPDVTGMASLATELHIKNIIKVMILVIINLYL